MTSDYTKWYRAGDITANKNSNAVIGHNTRWADVNIKPGDMFSVDSITEYEVDQVIDNTNLTLKTPYTGESVDHANYRIIRNWTASSSADIAAQNTEMLEIFRKYFNDDINTLQGESAYDIAVKNGFVGTESQWLESLSAYGVAKKGGYTGTLAEWLESLKAAGEWSNASERLASLEADNTANKSKLTAIEGNDIGQYPFCSLFLRGNVRGKFLGTKINVSDANYNIGLYPKKIMLGDYWVLKVDGVPVLAVVVDMCRYIYAPGTGGGDLYNNATVMLFPANADETCPLNTNFNDEADTTGGFAATKLYNETLPHIWSEISSQVPANYVAHLPVQIGNTNTLGANKRAASYLTVRNKLNLPSFYNISYRVPFTEAYPGASRYTNEYQFNLFKLLTPYWRAFSHTIPDVCNGSLIYGNIATSDVASNTHFYGISENGERDLYYNAGAKQFITPYFVLTKQDIGVTEYSVN